MKIILSITILILTVTAVAKYPVQNQTAHTASHNQDGQAKKNNPSFQPTPAFKSEKNVPLNPPAAKKSKEGIEKNGAATDWRTFVPNAAIAFGTIALALIGIIGTCAAIKTLKTLVRQTAATEVAAKAAKKSADLAEMTMRIIEAPDLCLDNAGLVPQGAITPESFVGLKVKNFGGSRAKNVRSFVKLIIPGVPDSELSAETFSVGRGGSQLIRFLAFREFLNQGTFIKIVRREILVRFSGDIVYEDVFGTSYSLNCRGVLNAETGTFALGDKDPREG